MKTWILALLIGPLSGHAGTFVGNGGGQGDVELAVTKKQIAETFAVVQKQGAGEYCRCNEAFKNRSTCEPLAVLNDDERRMCSKVMAALAPDILKMVGETSPVIVRWTNEEINVLDRGQRRPVDAVTNREKQEITINLRRFLKMAWYERVFLLTHELAHLSQYNGKPLMDEGPVGSFTGEEGGRRLLNAVGSAASIMQGSHPQEIKKYAARRHRSQSWKPIWVELHGGQAKFVKEQDQVFASDKFSRAGVNARYNFGDIGVVAGFRSESNDFTALDTIHVKETKEIFSLGVAYRFFPFGDPLSFWGQTHFQAQVSVDFVRARISLKEDLVPELTDEKNTVGGSLSASYYVPLFWGFWGYAGVAYEVHPYKYSKLNVDYKNNLTSQFIGVGYAF
jgi:hypothetical protein